jgi:hypothetical protein
VDVLRLRQLLLDARGAVPLLGQLVDLTDADGELLVLGCVRRGWAAHPGVVAGAGDLEHRAHRGDREHGLLGVDERETQLFSLAKKAAA